MKNEEKLQIFEIARDIAIAEHKHLLDRPYPEQMRDRKEQRELPEESRRPTVQGCFERSVRYMTSELSGSNGAD